MIFQIYFVDMIGRSNETKCMIPYEHLGFLEGKAIVFSGMDFGFKITKKQ
jgi:hypothetical protein